MNLKAYLTVISNFLKKEVEKANATGLVVGLSGGVDSAVAALLIKKVFPQQHLCLIMPCESDVLDQKLAIKLAKIHNLNYQIYDLTPTYKLLKKTIYNNNKQVRPLVLGNIKSRLRMTTLYAVAQTHNYLVCGAGNTDEWHIGYFTKYGDGGVDLLPLVNLLKQDIIAAAKFLQVIPEIINRPPSAGLWPKQTDETEMQFTYEELDNYLSNKKISSAVANKIKAYHEKSHHKRTAIPQAPIWNKKK